MNLNTIWSALVEGFYPLGNSEMEKTAKELGVKDGWTTLLWASWLFASEPFSTETFVLVRPYGSARVIEARFALAAKQGFLSVNPKNEYLRTEKGKHLAEQIVRSGEEAIAHLQPIPPAELQKVLGYSKRLVEATLDTPEPPSKFAIVHYYKNTHPGPDTPLLRQVLHYVGSLDQYRGAAHLDSWQDHNLAGYVWSALTSIWRDEANTLETLHEEMGASVFSRDEVLGALQNLTKRGWIEEESRIYRTTPEGGRIRQEAEELTDRYFFPPWACLNEAEKEELLELAVQLRDGLKDSTEQ